MADWKRIKNDYLNGGGSYRSLAEKYCVSASTLTDRAVKEGWAKAKEKRQSKIEARTEQKTIEKISETESNIAASQTRIKENIYREIEARMGAEEVSTADFRRLVQCYKDMIDIDGGSDIGDFEDLSPLAEMLWGAR